eukprot:2181241-Amphidinium_carterae.1
MLRSADVLVVAGLQTSFDSKSATFWPASAPPAFPTVSIAASRVLCATDQLNVSKLMAAQTAAPSTKAGEVPAPSNFGKPMYSY